MSGSKIILVISATGAQGIAVVDALLSPASDGSPSPYSVRALTRYPSSQRAQELAAKGVECARVCHYVWSNLDYASKKSGYRPEHKCEHYDGKGCVAEFMKQQDSVTCGMTWTIVTAGPYFERLYTPCLTWAGGHVTPSIIAPKRLEKIRRWRVIWWGGTTSLRRSPKSLDIHKRQSRDEWWLNWHGAEKPVANERGTTPDDSTSGKDNFSSFWRLFRNDIIKRDSG
ncbi:hypothetical protein BDN71DRAFT_1428709 [Pleurotus eryngii]|uniref:NmrA-like domain-containing protein n=1 Tax=Pleurotus eryngii TaxID=5323 RepID=A0A9P6A1U6_PLEER|nr:hypothetical protein BDN71DRAFT_1428709 [Pleurotus eryngii]